MAFGKSYLLGGLRESARRWTETRWPLALGMVCRPAGTNYDQRPNSKVRIGPSGIHIFNRLSGWNVLVDEIVPREDIWATAPRNVSIALTNACDLACQYSFAPKTRATLDCEHVMTWLHELDDHGALGVGFGGGEPTLHPQFIELCVRGASQTRLAITFTTHGHHLDDALLERLESSVHFVRVSMDGVNETYERLRHRSFSQLLRRCTAIRQISRFGINYVVNGDTFRDLDQAIKLAEELQASEFLLLPERRVNGKGGISNDVRQDLVEWVEKYSGGVPLSISENEAAGMPACSPFRNETGLREYAHVDAHGTLKLSSFNSAGIAIGADGIMSAIRRLSKQPI
jgi:MoaA/NifB/PqqE/SkfB family radical SAM enzyme